MTIFQKTILEIVRLVPPGKVASYGQIAAYAGVPRAARQVGWAMRSLEGTPDFPWWRILNNTGRITIKGNRHSTAQLQKQLLESEGVIINSDFTLDIARYRFTPDKPDKEVLLKQLEQLRLDPQYIRGAWRKEHTCGLDYETKK